MDSMIPIGQKNTLAEYMILSGADNRPPMLDKDLYDSWKSRMELYMQNRENGRMILESVKHGPLIWPTIEENGVTRTKKYAELSATEKIQADCDLKATNIILQGLPSDIYSLEQELILQEHEGINQVRHRVVKCFKTAKGKCHMVRQFLNEEELEFLPDSGVAEGPITQTVITHNAAYQADDLDAYDFDCNDFSTAKAVLMANLSSYGSDVLFEDTNFSAQQDAVILSVFEQLSNQVTKCNRVNKDNLIANESLSAELERYKEWVKLLEERQNMDLSTQEKLIIDDIIRERNAQFADFKKEINYLKQTLFEQSKEKELLRKIFNVFKNKSKDKEAKSIDTETALEKNSWFSKSFYLKKAQQIRPILYDGNVIAKETNVISIANSEETLMLEEENFGKRFVLQRELSDEQALHPNTDQSSSSPVKIEAPRELSKKQFLIENDRLLDQIKSQDIVNIVVNSSSDINTSVNVNSLLDINTSVNVNSSVAMNDSVNYAEMCNKCLKLEAELIKQHNMKNTSVNQIEPSFDQLFKWNNLKAELQAKDTTIKMLKTNIKRKGFCRNSIKNDLRKFKGKDIVDNAAQESNATTIAPGMYKLDPVTLAPKDKNNRETHIYYLKHTMEQAAILRGIVE
ncbi:hypothetical protein Tco_0390148 [Tanacetum coccineum]